MKPFLTILITLFLLASCNSSALKNEFKCESISNYSNLEKTKDVRKLFTVSLPNHWKTNLYYDNSQTSIYSADTTKSLTNTTLIDVTYIHEQIELNNIFQQKIIQENASQKFKNVSSKMVSFLKKPSYLNLSKGKKGTYSYQILNLFSKVNSDNFLHTKIEVYGDSLINERFCKAIDLVEKIDLN